MKKILLTLLWLGPYILPAQQLAPDPQFGNNGFATGIEPGKGREALALALQPDGKLVAGGSDITLNSPAGGRSVVSRFLANGLPDNSFGTNGNYLLAMDNESRIEELLIQPDGRILAVGNETLVTPPPVQILSRPFIARLKANGTPDSSFGQYGIHRLASLNVYPDKELSALTLLKDGRIVAGGSLKGSNVQMLLVCLNPDGSYHSGFGTSGVGLYTMETGRNAVLWDILAQSDDKILLTGYSGNASLNAPPQTKIALARVLPNGATDAGFGTNGVVLTQIATGPNPFDMAHNVCLQPDGKICVAGASGTGLGLARYMPDGAPDPAFGQGGKIAYPGHPAATGLALRNGKLYTCGSIPYDNFRVELSISGFKSDGTPDTEVGPMGQYKADIFMKNHLFDLLAQPDGKLVAAGSFTGANDQGILLARFGFDTPTAIAGPDNRETGLLLYPNPAQTQLTLMLKDVPAGESTIRIANATGQVLYTTPCQGSRTMIPVEKLAAGIYLLQLQTSQGMQAIKFIKR